MDLFFFWEELDVCDFLFFGVDGCLEDVVDVGNETVGDVFIKLGGIVGGLEGVGIVEGEAAKVELFVILHIVETDKMIKIVYNK